MKYIGGNLETPGEKSADLIKKFRANEQKAIPTEI